MVQSGPTLKKTQAFRAVALLGAEAFSASPAGVCPHADSPLQRNQTNLADGGPCKK
jgi:hypothetical protein